MKKEYKLQNGKTAVFEYDENEIGKITVEAMDYLIDMLPKWISCEKKMPKAEEKVWIQTQSGKVCFAMYEDGTISECDSNWSWFDIEYSSWDEDKDSGIIPEGWWEFTVFHPDCEFDCPVDEKVVAWMPLPEPYKEDEDDSERYGNATTKRGGHDAESRS